MLRTRNNTMIDGKLDVKYFPEEANEESLATVLSSLQNDDASIREEAVGQLRRYVNVAAHEFVDRNLSGYEALEAKLAAQNQVVQNPRIEAALLAAIEDPVAIVRSKAALLLGRVLTKA